MLSQRAELNDMPAVITACRGGGPENLTLLFVSPGANKQD